MVIDCIDNTNTLDYNEVNITRTIDCLISLGRTHELCLSRVISWVWEFIAAQNCDNVETSANQCALSDKKVRG